MVEASTVFFGFAIAPEAGHNLPQWARPLDAPAGACIPPYVELEQSKQAGPVPYWWRRNGASPPVEAFRLVSPTRSFHAVFFKTRHPVRSAPDKLETAVAFADSPHHPRHAAVTHRARSTPTSVPFTLPMPALSCVEGKISNRDTSAQCRQSALELTPRHKPAGDIRILIVLVESEMYSWLSGDMKAAKRAYQEYETQVSAVSPVPSQPGEHWLFGQLWNGHLQSSLCLRRNQ
ncbi:hypothetical protein SCUP515_07103 [Seiridium cupressi]